MQTDFSAHSSKNTKKINVLYFAALADSAGVDEEILHIGDDNLTDVFTKLSQKYHFSLSIDNIAVAVNHEFSDWNAVIEDDDTVAFIPPVAGG